MDAYAQIVIDTGSRWTESLSDDSLRSAREIPTSYFHRLAQDRFDGFGFLDGLSYEEVFSFIRGMVMCEQARFSPYPGSVSLVIWAFSAVRRRPVAEWAPIADWIVLHHDNPYSPFNFRRTRDQWLVARGQTPNDPVATANRAAELAGDYNLQKRKTAETQIAREHIAKLKTGESPDSPELRQRMIEEMEKEAGWYE